MRFCAVFVSILMASMPGAVGGEAPMLDYKTTTLDNGLKVLVLEDFSSPVVCVQLWYHVGGKDENPQRQGFAHMFEHMMFQAHRPAWANRALRLQRPPASAARATPIRAFDQTVYHEVVSRRQLVIELAFYLESERMSFLKIDQKSFTDTERKVVEEERRLGINSGHMERCSINCCRKST